MRGSRFNLVRSRIAARLSDSLAPRSGERGAELSPSTFRPFHSLAKKRREKSGGTS